MNLKGCIRTLGVKLSSQSTSDGRNTVAASVKLAEFEPVTAGAQSQLTELRWPRAKAALDSVVLLKSSTAESNFF